MMKPTMTLNIRKEEVHKDELSIEVSTNKNKTQDGEMESQLYGYSFGALEKS
uniref:Uncharacterized protein n=1 Tax=Setaria viridis TaxID=4556 RepID=A0A4U6W8E1_SETVI|nr:hypothetical protein SEVIR_2G266600v2 [Setaria viridis]TKW33857.1 hypothetical protein SEVIR_2G266600v2 [Setaria viridis]